MHTTYFSDSGGGYLPRDPLDRDLPWKEHGTSNRDPPEKEHGPGSQTGGDIIQNPSLREQNNRHV